MSSTIINFSGTGNLSKYTFRNVPPTKTSTYQTALTVEYLADAFTFTITNNIIVKVSMTAVLNPYPPAGVWKSFYANTNGINYTFNFTTNYNKCQVTYTGSLNNANQIGTIENYNKLVT